MVHYRVTAKFTVAAMPVNMGTRFFNVQLHQPGSQILCVCACVYGNAMAVLEWDSVDVAVSVQHLGG